MPAPADRSGLAIAELVLQKGIAHNKLSPEEIRAARAAVAQVEISSVDGSSAEELCQLAHEAYKQWSANDNAESMNDDLSHVHLRALCLLIYQHFGGDSIDEANKITLIKHWIQVAVMFMVGDEPAEARSLLNNASKLLDLDTHLDNITTMEVRCRLKATEAQLEWIGGKPQTTIQLLEEALQLVNSLGSRCAPALRRFLADDVALSLASAGHVDAEEEDSQAAASDTKEVRKQLIRLTDLSLSFLDDADSHVDLRDRALRLRAWLCILNDDLERAAQSLQQHSGSSPFDPSAMTLDAASYTANETKPHPTYMLLQLALYFKTSRTAEACAEAISWLSTDSSLTFERVRDTIDLLTRNKCSTAALEATSAILNGWLKTTNDPASSQLYSDIADLKYGLLTHGAAADSAAAAAHLENVINAHTSGKQLATPEALRRFGRKLWNLGCSHADVGQLHNAIEDIEMARRFMELSACHKSELSTILATLSHFYLNLDRFDVAIDRAQEAVQLHLGDTSPKPDSDCGMNSIRTQADSCCLARIVLIKANLKLDRADRAQEVTDALLASQPLDDHVLVAALCEDIVAMGAGHEAVVVALLGRFVAMLDDAPHGAPERSKLAGATRSLVSMREVQYEQRTKRSAAHLATTSASHAAGEGEERAGSIEASGTGRYQLASEVLADVSLVARRANQLGAAAVCDGGDHLDWLAQKAWNEGISCAKAESAKDLKLAVQLLQACSALLKSLQMTEERRDLRLRSHMVVAHCSLALHDLLHMGPATGSLDSRESRRQDLRMHSVMDVEADQSVAEGHLHRASEALADAFRLRQRGSFVAQNAQHERGNADAFEPDVALCVLNFDVSLRRLDPNWNALLSRAAETPGVQASHFVVMADSARKCRNSEAEQACLKYALERLKGDETKDFAGIALVLRRLIMRATSREDQLPYFLVMADSLGAYSAANCPLDAELLQWYLSSSYNMAVAYFNDKELESAEQWFSVAFKFLHLAPPSLQSSREELVQSYDLVMKELANCGPHKGPTSAPPSFYARMKKLVTALPEPHQGDPKPILHS